MMPLFVAALVIAITGFLFLLRGVQSRIRQAQAAALRPIPSAERYRPMLRLLSEERVTGTEDRTFRSHRRAMFRKYLRCLVRDYSQLLACIRGAMVASGENRPDLFRALARNRLLFTLIICRVELLLAAHALGVDRLGVPDLSGIIAGVDVLRGQWAILEPAFSPSR